MNLRGRLADEESLGDLTIRKSLLDKTKDFALAWREAVL
jgi:hypothetical protein